MANDISSVPAWLLRPKIPAVGEPPVVKQYTEIGVKRAELLKGMRYRTRNYLAITEKEAKPDAVSKTILNLALAFENRYRGRWVGRHIGRPADIIRYFCWLYLTGSRKREPFLQPYPRIAVSKPSSLPWKVVKVTRMLEKSFIKPGERTVHEQNIPIFDATEDRLWKIVLDDYEVLDISDLFERMERHDAHNGITGIIERNFKADVREEATGKLIKKAPITPHMLRHHRAYNLYIERGLDDDLVVSLFGWRDARMLGYYAYINRSSRGLAQLQALKKFAARTALLKPKKPR